MSIFSKINNIDVKKKILNLKMLIGSMLREKFRNMWILIKVIVKMEEVVVGCFDC